MLSNKLDNVNKILNILSADSLDRDDRVKCLYALASENLHDIAINWLSESYKKADVNSYCVKNLKSTHITIGTLFYIAKQNGVNCGNSDYRPSNPPAPAPAPTFAEIAHTKKLQNDYQIEIDNFRNAREITELDFKTHNYLRKKSKEFIDLSDNVRIYNRKLLIKSENTSAIQIVDDTQRISKITRICKKPESRGKRGSYAIVSKHKIKNGDKIYVCEGIATTFPFVFCDLHTVWAIDAGNLKHAVAEIRIKYPTNRIVVCADNDANQTGMKAARACGDCDILLAPGVGEDWNDVWMRFNVHAFVHQFAEPSNRFKNIAPLCNINCKYLSDNLSSDDLLIENQITTVKSVQGTGKTTLIFEALKKIISANKVKNESTKIIYVVPMRSLSKYLCNAARKTGIENVGYYDDYESTSNDQMYVYNSNEILFTTPQSVHKICQSTTDNVDLLVIDEAEQVARTVVSIETHKNKLAENYTKLSYLIAKAKYVVALDADIDISFQTVIDDMHTRSFSTQKNVRAIVNEYKIENVNCEIYNTPSAVGIAILKAVGKGKQVYIPCTSKARATVIYKMLRKKYPHKRGLLLTKDTLHDETSQYYLELKDFSRLDYLCVSPAVATGIDISMHNFSDVYAIIPTYKGITSHDRLQLIQRVRNVKNYHIYAYKSREIEEDDEGEGIAKGIAKGMDIESGIKYYSKKIVETALAEQTKRNDIYNILSVYENKREINEGRFDKSLIRLKAINEYRENRALFDSETDFMELAKQKGFNIKCSTFSGTEQELSEYTSLHSELYDEYVAQIANEINQAEIFSSPDFKTMLNDNNKTKRNKKSVIRSKAVAYYEVHELDKIDSKKSNKLLYTLYNNPKKIKYLEKLVQLLSFNEKEFAVHLQQHEINNKFYYLHKGENLASIREIFLEIFEFLEIDPKTGKKIKGGTQKIWSSDIVFLNGITSIVDKYRKMRGVEVDGGHMKTFNSMLRNIGIKVKHKKIRVSPSITINTYTVENTTVYKNVLKYYVHGELATVLDQFVCELPQEFLNNSYLNKKVAYL